MMHLPANRSTRGSSEPAEGLAFVPPGHMAGYYPQAATTSHIVFLEGRASAAAGGHWQPEWRIQSLSVIRVSPSQSRSRSCACGPPHPSPSPRFEPRCWWASGCSWTRTHWQVCMLPTIYYSSTGGPGRAPTARDVDNPAAAALSSLVATQTEAAASGR
jgi:hypothetical protein